MVPGRGALEDTSATCSGIDVMTTTTLNYTDDDNFNTRFSTVIRFPKVSIVTFWRIAVLVLLRAWVTIGQEKTYT